MTQLGESKIPTKARRPFLITLSFCLTCVLFFFLLRPTPPVFPSEETPIQFYSNQSNDNLQKIMRSALLQAQTSIYLVIYSLTDPYIIEAINNKALENISITIHYDAKANPSLARKLAKNIRRIPEHMQKGLMHRKILVIDNSIAWVGSANLTTDSLLINDNLLMGIHHPAFAQALTSSTQYETDNISFMLLPEMGETALEEILKRLNQVEHTLKIAMYTWTHPQLTAAVIAAFQRGVQVEVVIDRGSSRGASALSVAQLEAAGIPVRFNRNRNLLHYKHAILDDSTLIHGSTNWTHAAFTKNKDCLLILSNLSDTHCLFLKRLWTTIRDSSSPAEPAEFYHSLPQAMGF